MKMPRLRTMELWNGSAGLAGVFRFQIPEIDWTAKIIWRGTWDLPMEARVMKAWQTMVSLRMDCKLHFVTEILGASAFITSYGDAITHLRLSNTIMHPVSS